MIRTKIANVSVECDVGKLCVVTRRTYQKVAFLLGLLSMFTLALAASAYASPSEVLPLSGASKSMNPTSENTITHGKVMEDTTSKEVAVSTDEQAKITAHARWVIDNFGPQSGLTHFGYNAESFAYIDAFIHRQGALFQPNPQNAECLVGILGSFLGEAIIANHGGKWQQGTEGITVEVRKGNMVYFLNPFQKVQKRLMNGVDDSLHDYFSNLLPQVLTGKPL